MATNNSPISKNEMLEKKSTWGQQKEGNASMIKVAFMLSTSLGPPLAIENE